MIHEFAEIPGGPSIALWVCERIADIKTVGSKKHTLRFTTQAHEVGSCSISTRNIYGAFNDLSEYHDIDKRAASTRDIDITAMPKLYLLYCKREEMGSQCFVWIQQGFQGLAVQLCS